MLGNLSGGEILILMVIVLLVFGANRIPEAGRAVGKGMREFQRALTEARDAVKDGAPGRPGSAPPSSAAPRTHDRLID